MNIIFLIDTCSIQLDILTRIYIKMTASIMIREKAGLGTRLSNVLQIIGSYNPEKAYVLMTLVKRVGVFIGHEYTLFLDSLSLVCCE